MHKNIETLFHHLEQSKHKMLSLTESYRDDQLTYKPAADEWSMAQVIKHLVMTETQILQYIQKRMDKGELENADVKSWIRYVLVSLALKYRKKIKAPRQVAPPPDKLNPAEVKKEWDQLRLTWLKTLQQMHPEMINKSIFRHPLAGDMSIRHTLGFMNEHIKHHMAQIKRIRQSANWK